MSYFQKLLDDILKEYIKDEKKKESCINEIIRIFRDFMWY